jgi:hypothetical protein
MQKLQALANRIDVEYLSIHDLTLTELELYIEWVDCHYFNYQAV